MIYRFGFISFVSKYKYLIRLEFYNYKNFIAKFGKNLFYILLLLVWRLKQIVKFLYLVKNNISSPNFLFTNNSINLKLQ